MVQACPFSQNITTETLRGDDDRGFTHSVIYLKGQRKVMNLPVAYSEVNPTGLPSGNVYVLLTSSNLTSSSNNLSEEMERIRLVESCAKLHTADIFYESITSSWAAYHASRRAESNLLPSINGMLSLFAEAASSPSMLLL